MATVKELRALAKRQGHKGYSKMKKAQLEALVAPKPKPRRAATRPSDRDIMMDLLKARDEGRLGAGLPKPKPRRVAPKPPKRVGSAAKTKKCGFPFLTWKHIPTLKMTDSIASTGDRGCKDLYWEKVSEVMGGNTIANKRTEIRSWGIGSQTGIMQTSNGNILLKRGRK